MDERPLLTARDDDERIVLAASRIPRYVAVFFFAAFAIGIALLFPDLQAAPILFAAVTLWQAYGLLEIHDLTFDLRTRHLTYRRGRIFSPPLYDGPYTDPPADPDIDPPSQTCGLRVSVQTHDGDPGLVTSKLRSRRLMLHLILPDGESLDFPYDFPMGPLVAEEKARELSSRLGLIPPAQTAQQ